MKSSRVKRKPSHKAKRPAVDPTLKGEESLSVEDYTLFWDQYVKESDAYDKEMVKGMTGDLDTLLIFAGLFSAVNTAFIIDTYKDLKPDPTESTNLLLRNIMQSLNNSTHTESSIVETAFVASSKAIHVNALFFASLSCSLFAAFGAVLGKQWLNEYERAGLQRSSFQRGMQRHTKYLGLEKYHLELVVQTLPTILQISLFLFLIALSYFLWSLNETVAAVVIACLALTFIFYAVTTIISIFDSCSPFTTRFSGMLRAFLHRSRPPIEPIGLQAAQCVAWLKDQATSFTSMSSMAKAATLLPHSFRSKLDLEAGSIGPTLLQSIISNNVIQSSIVTGTLSTTMTILHDVIMDWQPLHISALTKDMASQLQSTLRFITSSDPLSSDLIIKTLAGFASGGQKIEVDAAFLEKLLQESSFDLDGKRAVITLLWSSVKDIGEERLRNWSRLPTFMYIGQALEASMWLDQAHTIPDTDKGRFEFRAWWLQQRPTESWFAFSFRKYLDLLRKCQATPDDIIVRGMDTVLSSAIQRIWNSSNWNKGWSICRYWENSPAPDTPCIAQELQDCTHPLQFKHLMDNPAENIGINHLMPCLRVYHLVTQHGMAVDSLVDIDYLHVLVSYLRCKGQLAEDVKKLLRSCPKDWSARMWFLEAIGSYIRASRGLITPDLAGAMAGVDELVDDILQLDSSEEKRQQVDVIQKDIATLFGSGLGGN